jgi:hypothetical protein
MEQKTRTTIYGTLFIVSLLVIIIIFILNMRKYNINYTCIQPGVCEADDLTALFK